MADGGSPARRPFRLRAQVTREWQLHAQVASILAIELAPAGHLSPGGACWFSIDHANWGGGKPGIRQGRGIIAGIPDILVVCGGGAFFVELKAPDGRMSPAQQEVREALCGAKAGYALVRKPEEMLAALDAWGVPRHRRVRL